MGTGKQRISTAARLEAKVEGEPVLELERALAAVAPVLVPVEVARRLGPVAVARRTKSVTAARRRGLPLLEAEEDLAAAVAETTREPVAAGAAGAWEAAGSVAAVAAEDVAAVGDEKSR